MKHMASKRIYNCNRFCRLFINRKKLPFRTGYNISSKLVNYAEKKKVRLDQLSKIDINKFIKIDKNISKVFDVVNSMNSKTSFGGTSAKMLKNDK